MLLCFVALVAVAIVGLDFSTRNSRWRMVRELGSIGVSRPLFHCSFGNDLDCVVFSHRIQRRGLSKFGRLISIDGSLLTNPDQDLVCIDDVLVGVLILNGTSLSDAGMCHVARMPQVNVLYLADTRITDQAIDSLASTRGLKCVILTGTSVTPDGIAKLKAARPDLYVVQDSIEVCQDLDEQ